MLFSCSGAQGPEVSLGECMRDFGETMLEQQDQDGRANPACQFSLILRLQEQLQPHSFLLRARVLTKMCIFSKCTAFWLLFLLRCLIYSHGMMIFLFFPLQQLP